MKKELMVRMKNRIALILLLLPVTVVLVLTGQIPTIQADCLNGLDPVAYWRLDEDVPGTDAEFSDSYGTNTATCGDADSLCPTQAAGELVDNSQTFADASTTGLKVDAASGDFDWDYSDSFAIEVWMKASTNTQTDVIVGRVDTAAGANLRWFLAIDPSGTASALISANNSEGNADLLVGTTDITDDQWHHLALVRNNATGENLLYVDGLLEDSASVAYTDAGSPSFASTNPVTIGWLDAGGFRLNGQVDEVAIYNQVLPSTTIDQHYINGLQNLGYCDLAAGSSNGSSGSTGGSSGCFIGTTVDHDHGMKCGAIVAGMLLLSGFILVGTVRR